MAINPDASPIPLSLLYTPNPVGGGTVPPPNQSTIQAICVEAGDRIYLAAPTVLTTGADVQPDGTPGQGVGYMPHWVYRPTWMRTQDVNAPPAEGTRLIDGLNGNASVGNKIRVDLDQMLYCPWAGQVTIEGGLGVPSGNGDPAQLQIAYAWDQKSRQHQRWWWPVDRETINRLIGLPAPPATARLPRVPVDGRFFVRHTLTFWNCGAGATIQRPAFATCVWTPDAEGLVLDNGPDTTNTQVRTNGESGRATLGCYNRITVQGATNTQIIFGIDL
jgi:hypothetical protein